jgi:hypothetical protein
LSIRLIEQLKVCKARGFTNNACTSLYNNLVTFYIQHNYSTNHIWKCDETRIHARQQSKVIFFVKKGSQVHNSIPKFKEWTNINCVINTIGGFIPRFLYLGGKGLEVIVLKVVRQGHAR